LDLQEAFGRYLPLGDALQVAEVLEPFDAGGDDDEDVGVLTRCRGEGMGEAGGTTIRSPRPAVAQAGALPTGDPERLRLLLIATLQGIATLVSSGRAQPRQTDALITDAVALFTRGQRLRHICQDLLASRRFSQRIFTFALSVLSPAAALICTAAAGARHLRPHPRP
jgi:hypothetical protein